MESEHEITDAAIITGIREGDRKLISTVYINHYPMIRKLVLDNNGSEAEAKDVLQEAVIVFYENIRTKAKKLFTGIRRINRHNWHISSRYPIHNFRPRHSFK